ncbi:hypothetical protein Ae406Ps2_2604c [Pseudonocardia sp. Ae406_Ps2]|nr:hypothetical protein Ae406Ps2_2604c [Pseudonocardia sp. Ae406_Ps2]
MSTRSREVRRAGPRPAAYRRSVMAVDRCRPRRRHG